MQTADFNHEDFSKPRAGDERLAIRFFIKAKQDGEASQKEGRPIFKEHEFIQIMIPGDRGHIIIRPVNDGDRGRFSKQYDHWKRTQSNDLVDGTPLEAWGIIGLAQIEEYKYFGIRTIEHMANIRDDLAAKITGTQILKQKAQVFLETAKGEAPMKKMAAELVKRDEEINTLKNALEEQGKILAELQAERKPRIK